MEKVYHTPVNHTPGPWFASGTEIKPLGNRPFICWTGTPERELPEARANANLIAAAPELLEMLEELVAFQYNYGGQKGDPHPDSILGRAETAIRKARGEA